MAAWGGGGNHILLQSGNKAGPAVAQRPCVCRLIGPLDDETAAAPLVEVPVPDHGSQRGHFHMSRVVQPLWHYCNDWHYNHNCIYPQYSQTESLRLWLYHNNHSTITGYRGVSQFFLLFFLWNEWTVISLKGIVWELDKMINAALMSTVWHEATASWRLASPNLRLETASPALSKPQTVDDHNYI